jgi:hypothetical protein
MNCMPMTILSYTCRISPNNAKISVVRTSELRQQGGLEVLRRGALLKQNISKVYYNRKFHDPMLIGKSFFSNFTNSLGRHVGSAGNGK